MTVRIAVLPGDGIGPDVVCEALKVLRVVGEAYDRRFEWIEHPIGGAAMDATGSPLPAETLAACHEADAILLGAIGGPKWSDPTAAVRPEEGLLELRDALGLYANLRPVRPSSGSLAASPLRPERVAGTDLVVVRELTGGIYFGPRREADPGGVAYDTMRYSEAEVARIAHVAFRLAARRRGLVTSIDKANVLASSRLWRRTVDAVASEYPDARLEHLLVDAAAMQLLLRPAEFDVMLTTNLFGDILSDEASMLVGSVGMLPSASLGEGRRGLYEPVHGSAPDIANRGIANPIGAILSVALLLRHSLEWGSEGDAVERSVERVLAAGWRTADLAGSGPAIETVEMGDRIADAVRRIAASDEEGASR